MSYEPLPSRASDHGPEIEPDGLRCELCDEPLPGGGYFGPTGKLYHLNCLDVVKGKAFKCSNCEEICGNAEKAPNTDMCRNCAEEEPVSDEKRWTGLRAEDWTLDTIHE